MLLSQDCLLKKKQTQNVKTSEISAILQLLLLSCYTMPKWILIQTYLHKSAWISSAALCILVILCNIIKYEADTNLLCSCKSESPLEMTADKHILSKCHNRTLGRVCSAQPEHFFSHLTVVPCQYHQVHWKSETTPCRNFHYLTETRVFTKLVMACVLLQGTTVAKIAHQLGILGGTE